MALRTPLFEEHRALGARIVEFGGWDMPLSYGSPQREHQVVRARCGLFDVSHMGEVELRGPGAGSAVGWLTTNDVGRLQDGGAQYTLLCNEEGGVVDDLLVYRLEARRFFLVVNAARRGADVDWMRAHLRGDVELVDQSDRWALLAVQGPRTMEALRPIVRRSLDGLRPFGVRDEEIGDVPVRIARTGYTGEDGVEIFVPSGQAVTLWRTVLAGVRAVGGAPVGLAARDTLRLEAGLLLHGSDMDERTTPWEAGLGWVVRGAAFVGREALVQARERTTRHLLSFVMEAPGVPRHGQRVFRDGTPAGEVTSGTKSPTLDSFIGLAYVSGERMATGAPLEVEMRGKRLPARVVPRPFYRRKR